jgi:MFS family permease
MVLLYTSRGYSLAQFAFLVTIMATTTFVLELPTGGLADALGRRRVLILGCAFLVVSKVLLLLVALSPDRPAFWIVAFASFSMGIYRALDSGPLASWYVDALNEIDATSDVEAGLGRGGGVIGFAIAGGSLLAGGIIAWNPLPQIDPMATVLIVSLMLVIAQIASIYLLMIEVRPPLGITTLRKSISDVPRVITETLGLARSNRVIGFLLLVTVSWSVAMVSFETLFPVRLEDLVGTTDRAAALLGPIGAVAWTASGIGASLIVRVSKRLGPYRTGALLRVLQAATIMGMAALVGPIGVTIAYIATYLLHGASNPVHMNLLHRQVDSSRRTTALSLDSMVGFATYSVAGIAIGAAADTWTVGIAMMICAVVASVGAFAYMVASRHDTGSEPGVIDRFAEPPQSRCDSRHC